MDKKMEKIIDDYIFELSTDLRGITKLCDVHHTNHIELNLLNELYEQKQIAIQTLINLKSRYLDENYRREK